MVNHGFGFGVGRQATKGLPAGCAWPILTRSRNPLDIARFPPHSSSSSASFPSLKARSLR
jgi:hypothetical protein